MLLNATGPDVIPYMQAHAALLVEGILILMVAECLLLLWLWRKRHRGISPGKLLPNIAAGFLLVLAVRFAVSDLWIPMLAVLALSFVAHLAEMRANWREGQGGAR